LIMSGGVTGEATRRKNPVEGHSTGLCLRAWDRRLCEHPLSSSPLGVTACRLEPGRPAPGPPTLLHRKSCMTAKPAGIDLETQALGSGFHRAPLCSFLGKEVIQQLPPLLPQVRFSQEIPRNPPPLSYALRKESSTLSITPGLHI
jgi:hypothetical protein